MTDYGSNGKQSAEKSLISSHVFLLVIIINLLAFSYSNSSAVSNNVNTVEGWKTSFVVGKFGKSDDKTHAVLSDPLNHDKLFKVYYKVVNGRVINFDDHNSPRLILNVTSKETGSLDIKIPRNYPYNNLPNDLGGPNYYGGEGMSGRITTQDGQETETAIDSIDGCFLTKSIPFSGNSSISIGGIDYLTGLPYHGYRIDSNSTSPLRPGSYNSSIGISPSDYFMSGFGMQAPPMPSSCISETIVQNVPTRLDGTITPLQQVNAGVAAQEVACPTAYPYLIIRADGTPYCLSLGVFEHLKKIWSLPPLPAQA